MDRFNLKNEHLRWRGAHMWSHIMEDNRHGYNRDKLKDLKHT